MDANPPEACFNDYAAAWKEAVSAIAIAGAMGILFSLEKTSQTGAMLIEELNNVDKELEDTQGFGPLCNP